MPDAIMASIGNGTAPPGATAAAAVAVGVGGCIRAAAAAAAPGSDGALSDPLL